jgi:hypothetical protein
MNQATKKGLIWGLALTAVGVGIYYLVKSIRNREGVDGFDEDEETQVLTSTSASNTSPVKVKLEASKWVEKGAKGIEVRYIQLGVNNIIKAAKQIKYYYKDKYNKLPVADKNRIDALAKIVPLKVDDDFGGKTLSAIQVIEGKSGANYCMIQKRRVSLANKYGLKNPYGAMELCQDKMVNN